MTDISRRDFVRTGLAGSAVLAAWDTALLGPALAADAPKRGGTLSYAQLSANRRSASLGNSRHPYFIVDANTRIQWNCLTWVNPNLGWELELASKVEPSDERLNVWNVTVREGVTFHNGREVTAADVASSFDYHRREAPFARQIVKIEPISKYVAQFTLDSGNSEFPYILAEYNSVIMPAGDLATIGMDGIGTGPFKIVASDPNRSLVMERYDGYWRKGFPYLDRLEIHNREGQQESALNGLRAGQFDAVLNIDARAAAQLQNDPAFDIESAKGGYSFVVQLPKHPGSPFLDKRVRQALAFAIDREAIVRIAYGGKFGWVGNDSHLMVTDPAFVPRPGGRDVARAKRLLAEAGYPNGFELVLGSPNDRYINDEKVAQAVAQMLARIGIKTSVDSMTASTFFTRRNKWEFSAYLAGWGADTGELSNSLVALVATFDPQTGFGNTNRGRYSNKAMDDVVRKALATIDDKAREALLQQAARMVQEDYGIIPLHFEVTPWAFRKGLSYVPRVDQYTLAFEVKPTP